MRRSRNRDRSGLSEKLPPIGVSDTVGRATLTEELLRISLADALQAVVDHYEVEEGVDLADRLGTPVGVAPSMDAPRIIAEGAQFVAAFSSGGGPVRGGGRMPILPPAVPRVPDAERLRLLLKDYDYGNDASPAERRLCRAHLWLVQALRSRRISAWAREWIVPLSLDQERVPLLTEEGLQFDPARWADCDIFYPGNTLRSRCDEYFETRHKGRLIRGSLVLDDVDLDEAQLRAALQDFNDIGFTARLKGALHGGHETWTIGWNNQDWLLTIPNSEVLNRGIRSIALLMRSPDRAILWPLMEGLARKKGHGRQKNIEVNKKTGNLYSAIDTISADVYNNLKEIEVANSEIEKKIRIFNKELEKISNRNPYQRSKEKTVESIEKY